MVLLIEIINLQRARERLAEIRTAFHLASESIKLLSYVRGKGDLNILLRKYRLGTRKMSAAKNVTVSA